MSPRQTSVAGHFGEFVQGRLGPDGPVVLITLPCPALRVRATWRPGPGLQLLGPRPRAVTPEQMRRLFAALKRAPRGRFSLRLPAPPGTGAGMSTASLLALAKLVAPGASAQTLASACLRVEGASDPLMLDRPDGWLWASRRAVPMAPLPPAPGFDVIGGFDGPPCRTDPGDDRFPNISDLLHQWDLAARAGDRARIAGLAALSARRCARMRGLSITALDALADALGALGYAIAHTGSARALLFAPGTCPPSARAAMRAAGLRHITAFHTGGPG